jgi:hypothetical protein
MSERVDRQNGGGAALGWTVGSASALSMRLETLKRVNGL